MPKNVFKKTSLTAFAVVFLLAVAALVFSRVYTVKSAGWYNSSWLNRQKITIATSITSSDLSNFPIMVGVTTTNDIFTDAQGDGDDILFTSSDGTTLLDYEIERYDKSANILIAWVQVPAVSSSVATDIYMYYNNSSASSNATSTGVWDGYEAVYHFAEKPATSTTYTFRQGAGGYSGAEDLNLESGTPTTNQNADTTINVDNTSCAGGGGDCHALMQWDISTIPSNCSVTSASVTINVSNATASKYGVYAVRRDWGETTATWNTYDGTNSWSTAGAENTTNDRYSTDLMNGNADTGWGRNSTGSHTLDFDSDGLAVIQDWIDGDLTNNGILIMDNDAGDTDGYAWADKTNATVGNRPMLSVSCNFAGTNYLDQTANNHDSTDQTLVATSTSPAWRGPEFIGTTANYVVIPNSGWSSSSYTIEALFNRQASGITATCGTGCTTDTFPLVTKGRDESDAAGNDVQWMLGTSDATDFTVNSFETSAGTGTTEADATASTDNIWYYAAVRMDATGNSHEAFLNASSNGATTETNDPATSQGAPVCIGAACNSSGSSGILGSWDGYIDEVRISHVARSADWLKASYRSIFGGGTYFTYAAEETEPATVVPTTTVRIHGGTRIKSGVRIRN